MKNLFTPLKNEYAKTACTAAVNKEQGILPKIVFCAMIILEKLMFIKNRALQAKVFYKSYPKKIRHIDQSVPTDFSHKDKPKTVTKYFNFFNLNFVILPKRSYT